MTDQSDTAAIGKWEQSHKPIVVAVDGSERNRSALRWAGTEAAAEGCGLVLVTALRDHVVAVPGRGNGEQRAALAMLDRARTHLGPLTTDETVTTRTVDGAPVEVLLGEAEEARMVVVGKRGLGGFARLLVGSTSIALAGRSPVPVAVVPDGWDPQERTGRPVVLGVDPFEPDHNPRHLAFRRAQRMRVPLVAVYGWEAPATYSWDADIVSGAISAHEQEGQRRFEEFLATWTARFPEVTVRPMRAHRHPATAVLDAAEESQLVVLGRHQAGAFGGFAVGSVARTVLHYAETPVLVVPT